MTDPANVIVPQVFAKLVVSGATAIAGGTADYSGAAAALAKATPSKDFELVLYTKTGLGDGQQANNPWLQEFPDPITRVSWDNYVTVSQADATKLELENKIVANGGLNGSYATLTLNGTKLENVPVIVNTIHLILKSDIVHCHFEKTLLIKRQ